MGGGLPQHPRDPAASFCQDPPRLSNTFDADPVLGETLARLIPQGAPLDVWRALGEAAAGPLAQLARAAEDTPPRHVPFDAWGRRVDAIEVSPAWTSLQHEAARWGLAAAAYEPALGPLARVHHFALLHLFGPSSAIWTCYLAMTDGAARTLIESAPHLAARVVPHLTSRDPATFWTSGQWMTERGGGSDVVGGTATEARPDGQGGFRLYGTKWFTSAITSEIALTLAREPGAAGLSLFYLEQRLKDGSRNGITIHRLKDKLGTRALPTAELTMDGTQAVRIGEPGRGVKNIAPLLNITRLHNAASAGGMMARLLQLLRDYAPRRVVFGAPLSQAPLHQETLAGLQVEYEAALALTLDCARLLGRREHGAASDEERAALRLATPLAKLATARQAVAVASEALEGFGGAGYVEDTGLPVYLRDAQVLPIWEGTTNVLSLDVRRAVARDGVLEPWLVHARARLSALAAGPLGRVAAEALAHLETVDAPPLLDPAAEGAARRFALRLAALAAAVPLCEQGAWSLANGRGERCALAAARWVRERIPGPAPGSAERLRESALLSGLQS